MYRNYTIADLAPETAVITERSDFRAKYMKPEHMKPKEISAVQ